MKNVAPTTIDPTVAAAQVAVAVAHRTRAVADIEEVAEADPTLEKKCAGFARRTSKSATGVPTASGDLLPSVEKYCREE